MNLSEKEPQNLEHRLALCKTFLHSFKTRKSEQVEHVWHEVYFFKGRWEFWCGRTGTTSTNKPDIIQFAPLPL